MTNTKQKIVNIAVKLFNEKGFKYVSMKDISDSLGISPGNLTYHFPKKELLIEAIHDQISEERKEIYDNIKLLPSFKSIESIFDPLMELYIKYKFFYSTNLDIVREYPKIHERNKIELNRQLGYIKDVITFSVRTGNMYPEIIKGQHDQLAMNSLLIFNGWIQYQLLVDLPINNFDSVRFASWNLIIPLMTPKGIRSLSKIIPELAENTVLNQE